MAPLNILDIYISVYINLIVWGGESLTQWSDHFWCHASRCNLKPKPHTFKYVWATLCKAYINTNICTNCLELAAPAPAPVALAGVSEEYGVPSRCLHPARSSGAWLPAPQPETRTVMPCEILEHCIERFLCFVEIKASIAKPNLHDAVYT